MKNLKKKFRFRINLKSKHLLAIMTLFCLCCIVSTFASGITTAPLQETAGIDHCAISRKALRMPSAPWSALQRDSFQDKQDLILENEELKAQIDSLTTQNNQADPGSGRIPAPERAYTTWTRPTRSIRRWQPPLFPRIRATGTIPL